MWICFGARFLNAYYVAAMAVEQEALDEKNAMLKVEETKSAASRAVELAIVKRKRAQLLMENADLVSYKAAVALRIAEAAQVAESAEAIADHFLDDPVSRGR